MERGGKWEWEMRTQKQPYTLMSNFYVYSYLISYKHFEMLLFI